MSKIKLNKANTIGKTKVIETKQMKWYCDPSQFKFQSTQEVEVLDKIVGQPRAVEAIRMGAKLKARGFNIFVTGLSGTGRTTAVKQILKELTTDCPITYDFLYVNNFIDSSKPNLIRLTRGQGKNFVKSMKESIDYLRIKLPTIFEEEPYNTIRKRLIEEYQNKEKSILKEFDKKIEPLGFIRGQLQTDNGLSIPEIFPLVNKQPVQIETIDELVIDGALKLNHANKLKENYQKFKDELIDMSRAGLKLMSEFRKSLFESDKNASKLIIDSLLDTIIEKYNHKTVSQYINEIKTYILENLYIFVPSMLVLSPIPDVTNETIAEQFNLFEVNLLLDTSETDSAPIVIERIPNYSNLFGNFDKTYDKSGVWVTDFRKIRAGSILQADQGYLIVNADDLFNEPGVWQAMKRVLLYNKLEIQPIESFYQMAQSHIKPEPIDVDVKVIIIGGRSLYRMLFELEKGFKKIFKVNAEFDVETALTPELQQNYVRFIARICTKEKLPHCSPDGVASILEWAVEQSGTQNRITLKFSDVADLLRETSFYDRDSISPLITRSDVKKTIEWKKRRHDLLDEKLTEEIISGNVMIATDGERAGQINGLTVLDTGLYSFGKPARITANVSAGTGGIINLEREANMSGAIHNKGVLIITGFLQERLGKHKALSLTVSLAFEQAYGGIDGDSASAAEIYVILSAISGVPVKQNIALTGSMNQKGDIQPIGGVNQKTIGFFEICRQRGFNAGHGVLIPSQNVKDLMLTDEVIEAVNNKDFTIYSFSKIEEGVDLMFGIPFETFDEKGNLNEDCLLYKVNTGLDNLRLASKNEEEDDRSTRRNRIANKYKKRV